MTIQASDFTTAFPEFGNNSVYPPGQIGFWITQGYAQLNSIRLGTSLDLAVMLYTAHNMVLSAREAAVANAGGIVGQASGPVSSEGVDKVSVSYDTGAASIADAGAWNLTSYGQRLRSMLRGFAAGPAYMPAPCFKPPYPGQPF